MHVPQWALGTLFGLLHISYLVAAFSFDAGTPTSCDDINISWSGGTAPYQLLIIPVFGTPRNISIPSSAFSNGKGNYSTQLQLPQSQKFLLTMSDATGFGTGGSTEVLEVGASRGGSCNTTDPGVAFSFQLNSALQQCRTFTFSDYTGAVQPVTIMGIIPGGESFTAIPPTGSTDYDWTADIWNGTSVIFLMADSQGRQGGSSDIRTVGISDDRTCINGQSPSSTISPTASSTGATTSTSSSSGSTPIGAIAGTILGGLVFLAVLITLGLFFLRRRQERQKSRWNGPSVAFKRGSRKTSPNINLLDAPDYAAGTHPYLMSADASPRADGTSPSPFLSHTQHSESPFYSQSDVANHSQVAISEDPFSPYSPNTAITPFTAQTDPHRSERSMSSRKASLAGSSAHKPSRFIIHTDAEDPLPPSAEEEEVIELPPQYSERRAPQTLPSTSSGDIFMPDHKGRVS